MILFGEAGYEHARDAGYLLISRDDLASAVAFQVTAAFELAVNGCGGMPVWRISGAV